MGVGGCCVRRKCRVVETPQQQLMMRRSCLHHHAGPDPAEQTPRVLHHIKINVLAQGLFSVTLLFVVAWQLVCVCVCIRALSWGYRCNSWLCSPVQHGRRIVSAATRWMRRVKPGVGAPGGDPAPLHNSGQKVGGPRCLRARQQAHHRVLGALGDS